VGMNRKTKATLILQLILILFWLAACNNGSTGDETETVTPEGSSTPAEAATATLTPLSPPTLDPDIPLAAIVNGQGITLEEFQLQSALAQSASETGLASFTEEDVLQNLIDETLLAQGAAEAGFVSDESIIQTRIAALGLDEQTLQAWISTYGFTPEGFEQVFIRSVAAAWMRDQIIAAVPSTTEQVHARQILLYNSGDAETVYAQLQAGNDFATLATQYDPLSSGELGWFPRGYLTIPELDDPIFSLQPGEFTEIIQTELGYHIVQVIEKEPQHPLSPGAYQTLQVQAVQNWLIEYRNQSDIQILYP
jgi:peptidyl-prolyl cis-trans isomerase C